MQRTKNTSFLQVNNKDHPLVIPSLALPTEGVQ